MSLGIKVSENVYEAMSHKLTYEQKEEISEIVKSINEVMLKQIQMQYFIFKESYEKILNKIEVNQWLLHQ